MAISPPSPTSGNNRPNSAATAEWCVSKSLARHHEIRISISDMSDADFLFEFDADRGLPPFEQCFSLANGLRESLGRPVDLVENHRFRNPYLRNSINESRELVYA